MTAIPLWKKIGGGARREIPCGVSIGIQDSVEQLHRKDRARTGRRVPAHQDEDQAGLGRGRDPEVRERFPAIRLMADANSAYTLEDAELLKQLDEFYLMMIEQPLAHDDIIDHAKLQAQLETPICLDECIRSAHQARQAIEMKAGGIINIKLGRVAASPKRRRCTMWRRRPMFRSGAAECWRRALGARITLRWRRCRTSFCRATSRRASAIGRATSSIRKWK